MPYLDELTPRAQAVGSVNTTKIVEKDGKTIHIGTNLDIQAILNSLRQALTGTASPFDASVPSEFREGQAAALVIGGGGATRVSSNAEMTCQILLTSASLVGCYICPAYDEAISDLHPQQRLCRDVSIHLSSIYEAIQTDYCLLLRQAIIKQFPTIDLRELTSVDQAKAELKELEAKGTRFCVGVGCIPSVEPASEGEKMVYDVARALFSHPYPAVGGDNEGTQHFSIPEKPIFFDMAYKASPNLLTQNKACESDSMNVPAANHDFTASDGRRTRLAI